MSEEKAKEKPAEEAKVEESATKEPKAETAPAKEKPTDQKTKEQPTGEQTEKRRPVERKIKNILRLMETNLDGDKSVDSVIRNIRGVSFMFGNAVSKVSGLGKKKLGELSSEEMKKLEDIIMNPSKYNIPAWLYNRKLDPGTGDNRHLAVSKLELAHKMDLNEMKKLRTYKGIRHSNRLPVRGQRTRSSFRRGTVVGVSRQKNKPASGGKKK
jgi:small subunit ribosomal protein S13